MRRVVPTAMLLLLLVLSARAGELRNAAEITERNRPLDRILDLTVPPRGPVPENGRTLALVIDPTVSLKQAAFDVALRSALHRNRGRLASSAVAVFSVSETLLEPTADLDEVAKAIERAVLRPDAAIHNVYAPVRRAAKLLSTRPGQRDLVLVTLENGDAEDDLEKTVAELVRAGVRVDVIAREAFLSDCWWAARPTLGLENHLMVGGEGAFPELPWSFAFQRNPANQVVASGFAMFGLTRLAAATGGRVYIHYPHLGRRSLCIPGPGSICPVCHLDHLDCGEIYDHHRLRALAPLIGPRREVGRRLAKDAFFQAAVGAWALAAKKGVMAWRPNVAWTGDGLRQTVLKRGKRMAIGDTAAFGAQASRAAKGVRGAEMALAQLAGALKHAETAGGSDRGRAIAEYTRVMLEITRFNFLQYRAFCLEVGPTWEKEEAAARLRPPEIPVLRPDYLYYAILTTNLSLCHGVSPYLDLRFPGGEALDRELARLDGIVREFLARYARTPFAQAVRRQCLVKFTLVGKPQAGVPPPRWIPRAPKAGTETPATGPARPPRGAGSGGRGGGTTTGGGE